VASIYIFPMPLLVISGSKGGDSLNWYNLRMLEIIGKGLLVNERYQVIDIEQSTSVRLMVFISEH
jgi:hypothetical protein